MGRRPADARTTQARIPAHICSLPLSCSQKIRTRFLSNPELNKTLESLVENEKHEKKRTATEGLLWLTRSVRPLNPTVVHH